MTERVRGECYSVCEILETGDSVRNLYNFLMAGAENKKSDKTKPVGRTRMGRGSSSTVNFVLSENDKSGFAFLKLNHYSKARGQN